MTAIRERVCAYMVEFHLISRELAVYHVEQMTAKQVRWRFLNYARRKPAGTELSVAGPNPRAVNESSTRFSRPQRRRQADGTQLRSRESRA